MTENCVPLLFIAHGNSKKLLFLTHFTDSLAHSLACTLGKVVVVVMPFYTHVSEWSPDFGNFFQIQKMHSLAVLKSIPIFPKQGFLSKEQNQAILFAF